MKQKVLSSLFLLMTMLLGVPLEAFADREVNQLQFGKQTILGVRRALLTTPVTTLSRLRSLSP